MIIKASSKSGSGQVYLSQPVEHDVVVMSPRPEDAISVAPEQAPGWCRLVRMTFADATVADEPSRAGEVAAATSLA